LNLKKVYKLDNFPHDKTSCYLKANGTFFDFDRFLVDREVSECLI